MRHEGLLSKRFHGYTRCVLQIAVAVAASVSVAGAQTYDPRYPRHERAQREYARHKYARAETAFDGPWSVLIQTQSGPCDRSFRYGVNIVDGAVTYQGNPYGRVAPNGSVRVRLSLGDQHAEGVGRLSRVSGTGVWRGAGENGVCTGRWFAERRGVTTGAGR